MSHRAHSSVLDVTSSTLRAAGGTASGARAGVVCGVTGGNVRPSDARQRSATNPIATPIEHESQRGSGPRRDEPAPGRARLEDTPVISRSKKNPGAASPAAGGVRPAGMEDDGPLLSIWEAARRAARRRVTRTRQRMTRTRRSLRRAVEGSGTSLDRCPPCRGLLLPLLALLRLLALLTHSYHLTSHPGGQRNVDHLGVNVSLTGAGCRIGCGSGPQESCQADRRCSRRPRCR
jgi:hypothetical protein